jgi:hypothetical protein
VVGVKLRRGKPLNRQRWRRTQQNKKQENALWAAHS